jgi:pimeloyl-ACP methyl ester carboxylesterase
MPMRVLVALFLMLLAATVVRAAERWQSLPEPPPMPPAAESGFAPVNGIRLHYAVYGAGPPVLLIHGGLGHADLWANQVAPLVAAGYRVIVADSRGHGRSTRSAEPFGYELMAADYVALLDHLKIERVALVGWSDGGIIGLAIAMRHPGRLTRLFAHAANATTDAVLPDLDAHPVFGAFIRRMGDDYRRLSPTPGEYDAFVAQIGHMWASQPAWTAVQLRAIRVPTTIALGERDEAIARDHTDYLAATIPGARLAILPGVSHFAMLQDPDGYTRALLDFLAGS